MKIGIKLLWLFDIVFVVFVGIPLFRSVGIQKWNASGVRPQVSLPTPMVSADQFEYCVLTDSTRDSVKAEAGTPIPSLPVIISTPAPTQVAEIPPTLEAPRAVPTPLPLQSPTSEPPALLTQIDIVRVGNFDNKNWHFVFVGVGTEPKENQALLENFITQVSKNFSGVSTDFAYVKEPLFLGFNHIESSVDLNSKLEGIALFNKIKVTYPVDSLIFVVSTPDFVGSSRVGGGGPYGSYSILTVNNSYATFVATHELGHQMGMGDGYQDYYPPGRIPNQELFYIDSMPRSLIQALKELGYTPPMYLMGTCNGKSVYSFYPGKSNIYGDVGPVEPDYLNTLQFSPLQILEMNDYVSRMKGGK